MRFWKSISEIEASVDFKKKTVDHDSRITQVIDLKLKGFGKVPYFYIFLLNIVWCTS